MIRKIVIIVVCVVMAISLLLNIYHYGYRWAYSRGFQDGVNGVSNAVAQQYKETGRVIVTMEDKQIVLVPQADPVTAGANQLMK